MFSKFHESFEGARATRTALLLVCFLLGAAAQTNAAGTLANGSANSSPRFNAVFAIADFDGDCKPDFATVESQDGGSSRTTRYSIRFRLTAGPAQSFGVSAPAGGLQIVARDVNGDDALDLLVSTAWLHQQVAVLLNDGHGNFTLAKANAFPGAVWESEAFWESKAGAFCESAVLAGSEYSAEQFAAKNQFPCLRSGPVRGPLRVSLGKARLFLFSLLGRAPPLSVHQA
ncbi:MAG: VCBS repeat-containing protein [Candidatus Acidiferrum sp.]